MGGHGTPYHYHRKVYAPTGPNWHLPKNWRFNTAIITAGFLISALSFGKLVFDQERIPHPLLVPTWFLYLKDKETRELDDPDFDEKYSIWQKESSNPPNYNEIDYATRWGKKESSHH
eukprot:TRINITY_DN2770_c0_g1_i1.p1 TRINITY_DN2770_c0_g1~~TRINITY_DN2770_c0_g1_i1.p1  ORF type:complete len:125 (-),score=20.59 TRINITY_DN2770_c0_g1_i1:10-360(-)